ncbi:TRAP transporter large permease [Peptoniphilus equinus]|uniref:TRAP transporter large permease n=1 Tax=Peptoniphilus equinus TaxID=3016343 RepID=A0ABY7QUH7_9FIRM|nr:TRAP transporter large permease [Peptoniphilus equinus]WBW50424.1 TRAP transporter large permease [Peptoniphilus equinus]
MSLIINIALIMLVLIVVLLILGVPISVSIGLSSAVAMLLMLPANVAFTTSAQRVFAGSNSFSLVAIPFFVLAGNIMNNGGIATRLVNVSQALAGKQPGSLAITNIIANMFFGAISGSAAAAAAAIGAVMGPIERKEGYDSNYSVAANVASAPTGTLIPPSNTMIVFSTVAGSVSIAALFLAGYVPGILWGCGCIFYARYVAKKRGYVPDVVLSNTEKLKVVWQALPSLLLIVIIVGGILAGIFTPTEASAISVVYSLLLSLFYKSIKMKDLPKIILESAITTGIITFMIGVSSIMSWSMAFTEIPDLIAQTVLGLTSNKYVILLIMNVILLVVGTFMDATPAILIFTPIFLPIVTQLGVHPVHFGIILCMNLAVGIITPPVGTVLFTGCRVGGVTIESVIKDLVPYFVIITISLLLVTFIPAISLFLPTMAGLI